MSRRWRNFPKRSKAFSMDQSILDPWPWILWKWISINWISLNVAMGKIIVHLLQCMPRQVPTAGSRLVATTFSAALPDRDIRIFPDKTIIKAHFRNKKYFFATTTHTFFTTNNTFSLRSLPSFANIWRLVLGCIEVGVCNYIIILILQYFELFSNI